MQTVAENVNRFQKISVDRPPDDATSLSKNVHVMLVE